MPTLLESVSRLTDCAKKLRAIADELNSVEIKSEIVDQIILIQEIREEILTHGEDAGMLRTDQPAPSNSNSNSKLNANAGLVRVEPPSESETYGFVKEPEPEPEPPPAEPAPKPVPDGQESGESSDGESNSDTPTDTDAESSDKPAEDKSDSTESEESSEQEKSETEEAPSEPDDGMTPEQRAVMAEMRISELEPLQQAVVKRMNDILTPEQKKLKSANTKVGQKKGLSGKQLQQFVISSLELSEEQQTKMTSARKELHDLRVEIKRHVANLLTDEQRAAIAGKAD